MNQCNVCKKEKKNVSLQPSRSQLLFGGFRTQMEYRCTDCEKKIAKWSNRMIDSLCKRTKR